MCAKCLAKSMLKVSEVRYGDLKKEWRGSCQRKSLKYIVRAAMEAYICISQTSRFDIAIPTIINDLKIDWQNEIKKLVKWAPYKLK